jgi:peroxiredoxin
VGVNVKDKLSSAQAFQRAQATSYPSLSDQPGRVALAFRGVLPPDALPSTLVLDRTGRVAARFLGGVTQAQLTPVIEGVLSEPVV